MSNASSPSVTVSLPALAGTLDYPAIERQRRDQRIEEWVENLQPDNPLEHWLVGRAASITLNIERLELAEAEERQTVFVRAARCWESDRQAEAEVLALKLRKQPGAISRKLRSFKQGAQWLLDRWTTLLATLNQEMDWNEDQKSLALDLLGVSEAERTGFTPIDLRRNLGDEHSIPMRRELANNQVNTLIHEITVALDIVDKQEHRQTVLGHSSARPGTALAAIRREIAAASRQLRWALDTFHKVRNNHFAAAEPSIEPKPTTEVNHPPDEEAPEQNEPNLRDENAPPTFSIDSDSARPGRNRRSRRALASTLKRRRA